MEGILEALDSWRSLTHHPPIQGSEVSDYPGGGVLGGVWERREEERGRGGGEKGRKEREGVNEREVR